jgi:hypothetical protein
MCLSWNNTYIYFYFTYLLRCLRVLPGVRVPQVEYHWNIGRCTGYYEWCSWFSSVPPGRYLDSTSVKLRPLSPTSLPIYRYQSSYHPTLCSLDIDSIDKQPIKKAIVSLNSTKWLAFVMKMHCVFCQVWTEFLNFIVIFQTWMMNFAEWKRTVHFFIMKFTRRMV